MVHYKTARISSSIIAYELECMEQDGWIFVSFVPDASDEARGYVNALLVNRDDTA